MTNNNKPSREEMIQAIYEKIARKDLSFGCKIIIPTKYGDEKDFIVEKLLDGGFQARYCGYLLKKHIGKIIGHPVMIGDLFDFLEKNIEKMSTEQLLLTEKIFPMWREKRKPIEDQSNECIEFVYNLISE